MPRITKTVRILIIRLGAIGDIICTLPALAAIKSSIEDAIITWVVERGPSQTLLDGNPFIDEVVLVDLGRWRNETFNAVARAEASNVLRRLRGAHFDLSLDFQGLLKSAVIPWLARIPRRIGFDFNALREPAAGLLLSERVPANDSAHVIEKNLTLARHLGCAIPNEYQFPLAISQDDRAFAERIIERLDGEFAILNPGGGWETKLWGVQNFSNIADRLWHELGLKSLITFGPGEGALAESVVAGAKAGSAFAASSTLKQFFAIARNAAMFIGGDTGPMFLAAAAGAPIVSIFGPTSSRRNGPFDERDIVVERNDLECRIGCYRRRCEHISCMDIPAEAVWRAITERHATAKVGMEFKL
jgi:lipopolysaccharide heptosyltransferase I